MTTIQDIAKRAGVSITIVSRVLHKTAYVNAEITARVRRAAKELQYQPGRATHILHSSHTTFIGLLINDIQRPFATTLIQSIENAAQRSGYSVVLCNADENAQKERRYIDLLCSEHVAGVIVVPVGEHSGELQFFREHAIPIVVVDQQVKDRTADAVLVDNVSGAYEAVTHLIANGYRRVGLITGPISTTAGRERLAGYRQALHDADIPHDPALERIGILKEESGRQLADELLSLKQPVDALFITNNLMTMGALEAIYARRLRIPDDVAIVGFDEMPWAALSLISLTTVTQPVYELGSTAARRLIQRLENPSAFTQQEIVLTPTLRIRGSSQPRKQSIDTTSTC